MKRKWSTSIFFLTFLTLLVSLIALDGFVYAAEDISCEPNINVCVYYYPWYGTYEHDGYDRHWPEGYLRGALDPNPVRQEPILGEYSCRDDAAIRQQLKWCEDNGIDTWICSWWGYLPGRTDPWVAESIEDCIMPTIAGSDVKFCLFYESVGLLGGFRNGYIWFDSVAIKNFTDDFQYMAQTYFNHPNYLKIDGKPVVYIYLTRTFGGRYPEAIRSIRNKVKEVSGYDLYIVGDEIYWDGPNIERIALLDAVTSYNMHGHGKHIGYPDDTGFVEDVRVRFEFYKQVVNQLNAERGLEIDVIPNIMPGFNNKGVQPYGPAYIIPRQSSEADSETSTFSKMCDMVKTLMPGTRNMIAITSWNEWHEDTQIEPTVVTGEVNRPYLYTDNGNYYYRGYGDGYLKIIKEKFGAISIGLDESVWVINNIGLGERRSNFGESSLGAMPLHNVKNNGIYPVKIGIKYASDFDPNGIRPGKEQGFNLFITLVKSAVIPSNDELILPDIILPNDSFPLFLTYGAPTEISSNADGMSAAYEIKAYPAFRPIGPIEKNFEGMKAKRYAIKK